MKENKNRQSKDTGLFAAERHQRILGILKEKAKVTVAELSQLFGVSAATIRSDLRLLDRQGYLVRTHGGALSESKAGFEPDNATKHDINSSAKRAMARVAEKLIEEEDTILLDAGTTTYALARRLVHRTLTVVTNDLEIARLLTDSESVTVIQLGGMVRKRVYCATGGPAVEMLQTFTVDRAFMGANAFSFEKGATTPNIDQATTKRAMIASAAEVILMCSQRKMDRVSFAQFATPQDIDKLVIEKVTPDQLCKLEEFGIQVLSAGL